LALPAHGLVDLLELQAAQAVDVELEALLIFTS
jgi:hypothetical protein